MRKMIFLLLAFAPFFAWVSVDAAAEHSQGSAPLWITSHGLPKSICNTF